MCSLCRPVASALATSPPTWSFRSLLRAAEAGWPRRRWLRPVTSQPLRGWQPRLLRSPGSTGRSSHEGRLGGGAQLARGAGLSILSIRDRGECRWDMASLGEVMLRLDPGEGRIASTRIFRVWEGGGEYNVARGLRKCFGLRT